MDHSRLLIISNRLPYTVRVDCDSVRLVPAAGGLATGLRPWHEQSQGLWIGWPGELSAFTPSQRERTDRTDEDLFRALPDTSITVAVGPALASARYRVTDYREVRQLLRRLASPAAAPDPLLALAGGTM